LCIAILNKQKCHFFSFTKSENRRAEQVLFWRGEKVGKGCERMNIVQILCTHLCKWKMMPVETIPGMGRGGNKGD
jgi:hypothetical protein